MIVVDASAVVALLKGSEPVASSVRFAFGQASGAVNAPELLDLEVTNAFRRLIVRREVVFERADEALLDLWRLAIVRWRHGQLIERVWELRHNLVAYDAAYLALAEGLDATLLTLDDGLAKVAARTVDVAALD